MSGSALVTPGFQFTNEPVTLDLLNQLGRPSVQIGEHQVGLRELDLESLISSLGSSLNGLNFLAGGNFDKPTWLTPSGVSAPAASFTFNQEAFWVKPVGAAVTYRRSTTVPDTLSLTSAEIEGAASVQEVDFGQDVLSYISGPMRQNVTMSVYIYNETGASFTPIFRIDTPDAEDSFSSTANRHSQNLQECVNGQWTKVFQTVDLSSMVNITNGIRFYIRIPNGSLNDGLKKVRFSRFKIELGTVDTPLRVDPPVIIGASRIGSIELKNGSVINSKMATDSVSTPKVIDRNITPEKVSESVQFDITQLGDDSGAANAYQLAISPAPLAYTAGMVIRFKADFTNTGASTVQIAALGAKAIKKNATDALTAGDIKQNAIIELVYDGTNFQLLYAYSDFVGDSGSGGTRGLVPAPPPGASSYVLGGSGLWVPITGLPTGVSIDYFGVTAPSGWIFMSGRTIGDGSSSATERANSDTQALFELIWNSIADSECPVSSGRGANATADFNAHKTITVPDARGRVIAGKDNMGGTDAGRLSNLTASTLGKSGGAQTHTLTEAELASHYHTLSGWATAVAGGTAGTAFDPYNAPRNSDSKGSNTPHNNVQPTLVANKIIKL
jgi:microcystin-dependent protein